VETGNDGRDERSEVRRRPYRLHRRPQLAQACDGASECSARLKSW
jgi:hypothetical protein